MVLFSIGVSSAQSERLNAPTDVPRFSIVVSIPIEQFRRISSGIVRFRIAKSGISFTTTHNSIVRLLFSSFNSSTVFRGSVSTLMVWFPVLSGFHTNSTVISDLCLMIGILSVSIILPASYSVTSKSRASAVPLFLISTSISFG